MANNKAIILNDVKCSVGAMNDVVVLLRRDQPLRTDIIDSNYSPETVNAFLKHSRVIVQHLQSASDTTSRWLSTTGDSISANLVEARRIRGAAEQSTCQLRQNEERTRNTSERIRQLENGISTGERSLSSARSSLSGAESELDRKRNMRNVMRAGAVATLFFAPIFSVALAVIDLTAMEKAIDEEKHTIRSIEGQLASSRSQLEAQRGQLSSERTQSTRLSSEIASLRATQKRLEAQASELQRERASLATLSQNINDCLLTVNAALSSSATISSARSMRNVVSGIRGVVSALGADATFAGPVAMLDDAALMVLDRQVEAIRHSRLMV